MLKPRIKRSTVTGIRIAANQDSARGGTATALCVHSDQSKCQLGARRVLPRRREKRTLRRARAATLLRDLEPALHRLGVLEQRLDLVELPARKRAHLLAHALGGVDAIDQLPDLAQLEACALRYADETELAKHVRAVPTLPVESLGLGKEANPLVVSDRRGRNSGPPSHFSDRQFRELKHPRDQALT